MGKSILKRLLTMTTGFILAAGVVFSNGVSMNVEAKDLTLITDSSKIALFYREKVFAAMGELRACADELEVITPKDLWPFPSYGDLLYSVR